MHPRIRHFVALTPLVGVIAACGGTAQSATQPSSVDQTPAYKRGYGIGYNAVLIFGFAQAIWLVLARDLPPVASTMSVMLIPVLGTLAGAWWLGEQLHWQDGAAMLLMLAAIGSVLVPARTSVRVQAPETGQG